MRSQLTITVALLISLLKLECQTVGSSSAFVLRDEGRHRWCAYAYEKPWKEDISRLGSLEVATVHFVGEHISVIQLNIEDEAGDWMRYDSYSLRSDGAITGLKRTVNVAASDASRREIYSLSGERLVRSSVSETSLESNKKPAPKDAWIPSFRVIRRLDEFPFSGLLKDIHQLIANQRLCSK